MRRRGRQGKSVLSLRAFCQRILLAMRVRLLCFGVLKDIFAQPGETPGETLELPAGSTVQALLETCSKRVQVPAGLWASVAVAVNRQYAGMQDVLHDDDEVALLPPVSGGYCA